MVEDLQEIFTKIGITKQESKVYIALLELQEAQTGLLCNKAKIPSSNIYRILDSLTQKGLVSHRIQNNTKIFMPTSPETLNNIFQDKQKQLEEERKHVQKLIENLKKIPTNKPASEYKYYEGITGIKALWNDMTDSMDNSKIHKIYTRTAKESDKLRAFFTEGYHVKRRKEKIKTQMIMDHGNKEHGESRKKQGVEVRYTEITTLVDWGIINDQFFIEYYTEKVPRAFLITDKIFAQAFSEIFDKIWTQSKK
jgi:sugar-specific transcriptional regulator TrmB